MSSKEAAVNQTGLEGRERSIEVLKALYLTRFLDEKMGKLVRQNKGGTFHISVMGHEMVGVVGALSLTPGKDWGLPYYRDRAFAVGIGCTPEELIAAFLARDIDHHSGGRMMPEHFSHKELRLPCQSSCVGSQFLQAVGVAKAVQLEGSDELVYVSAGDGATSQGDFHEALNFSCLHRLGVIFAIQDNGWAISVPVSEQTTGGSIASIARGYPGLAVFDIDGTDYEETSKAFRMAVERGRRFDGPSLIVAKVPRIGPHSSSDDPRKYKSIDEEEGADLKRDPIARFEEWLKGMGLVSESELEQLQTLVWQQVERAADAAEEEPFPKQESCTEHLFKQNYSPDPSLVREPIDTTDGVVMMDAINHALDEEMERDSQIVVFGQDVAKGKGGVFGITRNLTKRFGENRCFNTPLAESTIVALALGMSVKGFKPVAEIQFADYFWTGVNQLFNELASYHYRSKGEWHCPVVMRMPYGGYIQGGPYHSQSIEAFLCHCPGLKVVVPSNASDAKRLLKSAIRDPDPVLFLEHKALYRQRSFCARREPGKEELLPFGKANIVKEGRSITLVGWGMMIFFAFEIAERLEREGISVEVIDLRTLVPLDIETVLHSVRKTGKLLIAHEAPEFAGFGAEIAAQVASRAFSNLDAPIRRVGGKNVPVPYAKVLEDAVLPQAADLEKALRELYQY